MMLLKYLFLIFSALPFLYIGVIDEDKKTFLSPGNLCLEIDIKQLTKCPMPTSKKVHNTKKHSKHITLRGFPVGGKLSEGNVYSIISSNSFGFVY